MTIKVNPLSLSSVKEAEKKIRDYQKTLETKTAEYLQRLTDVGLLRAVDLVPIYHGGAVNSITGYVEDNKGIIRAGGYCAFIEFGTGVKGEGSPHPSAEYMAAMKWAYNVGTTIFTTKDGRTGWFFPADDGTWKFTEGMPSRPFMYETALYLKSEYKRIAKEIFNGQG